MDFSIDEIFRRVEGAIVDDGGNVQNMIVNAAYFLASLNYCSTTSAELPEMIAFASSDPFELLPEKLSNQLGEVCTYHNIELEDRFSLQSPFLNQETNEQGVLAFTSVPKLASGALIDTLEGNSDLEREFGKSDCYVLSEPQNPLVNYMGRVTDDSRKAYRVLINASTAFRPQVATESFAKGVVLPMNNEEASEVARIFMVQGLGEEMSKLERPPFPCPLTPSANEIDPEALKALDTSMFQYNRFNPFGPQNYACPISFGPLGGLIVGTGIENLVCFTSIPSNEGSKSLLKTYGASEIDWATHQTTK